MIAIRQSPLAKLFAKIKAEMVANGTPFADAAAEAAFRAWLRTAWLDSGCTQDFLCLSQPASSTTIRLDVRTASAAHRTNVWWGDGTTGSYTTGPSADTALSCTYAAGALRPVVVVGRLTRLYVATAYNCAFGGRISTARSLTSLYLSGNLLTVSGVPAFSAPMRQIYLRPATADLFSQADIDAIWNTAAAIGTTWTIEKLCDTRGNCPSRTSASDAAFATLQSRGVACYSN